MSGLREGSSGALLLTMLVGCSLARDQPGRTHAAAAGTQLPAQGPAAVARPHPFARGPAAPQVGIPPGVFTMGCVDGDEECEADERPAHSVRLPEFRMDRFEVTWSRYAECVDAGACSKIDTARCYVWNPELVRFVVGTGLDDASIGAEQPVVCVDWKQARAYCRFRGGALPTEAQWERAARADTRTRYPWGDERPSCDHARYVACVDSTRPVGTARAGASWYGAQDMAGNVWEWVADWYGRRAYAQVPVGRAARGPWEGEVKVVRGGSYYDDVGDLRASYRYGLSPQFGYSTVGFRCAARVR